MAKHDLLLFFSQATQKIQSEYERITQYSALDGGTAGDEGEENWKKILEEWLPSSFKVVTKGQILYPNGEFSPQVDIIVLKPNYPSGLIHTTKRYLAHGVAAAFEAKLTLRKSDTKKVFINSAKIKNSHKYDSADSPYTALNSPIIYGLLAHSTEITPDDLTKNLASLDKQNIHHPIEMIDLICVSNIGTWVANKMAYLGRNLVLDNERQRPVFNEEFALTGYLLAQNGNLSAIGHLIMAFTDKLAWRIPELREISKYYAQTQIADLKRTDQTRQWALEAIYPQTIIDALKEWNTIKMQPAYDPWLIWH